MKTIINKLSVGLLSMLAAFSLILTGCSKVHSAKTETATVTQQQNTPFSFVPSECNIIGKIDVAKLCKLDVIKKQIDANKNKPFVKELELYRLTIQSAIRKTLIENLVTQKFS